MALNPIGNNFLTPMATMTTWNKGNLQIHEDGSPIKYNNDPAIMSNPAAT